MTQYNVTEAELKLQAQRDAFLSDEEQDEMYYNGPSTISFTVVGFVDKVPQ